MKNFKTTELSQKELVSTTGGKVDLLESFLYLMDLIGSAIVG